MERLKKEALKCKKDFGARERGYFKPAEDDKVAHLKLSYLKTRAALLEIALEAEKNVKKEDWSLGQYEEFLIGYGAALVLVDAARFLVKNFSGSRLILEKLNEPNELLGIGQGLYDKVQESLNDPTRLLSLVWANSLFEAWGKKIKKAEDKKMRQLTVLIRKLRKANRLDSANFIRERLSEMGNQMVAKMALPILSHAYEIQKSISKTVSDISLAPKHKPNLPVGIQAKLIRLLQPGDVFITRKEHFLTNYFLPGYWPHAALYLGTRGDSAEGAVFVLESMKDGVKVRPIESVFGSDAIAVLRPKINQIQIEKAIKRALTHEGKPYDFDFDFKRSDRLVCTEVIYRGYEGIGGIKFKLTKRAGRLNLSAEDLLQMSLDGIGFEPIVIFCPDESDMMAGGEQMAKILKATMGRKKAPDLSKLI